MIETEDVGMLASALEGMEYEDAKEYADVLAWDGPDPNPVDKRKRAISDGEVVERRPQPKRPTLKPVGSGRPGRAIPEEDLAGRPSATIPAELLEKTKKKRRHPNDREPIRMMKGQPKFDTVATLRDTEVRGMTYGQLFLLAPSTRQEVSYGLVQERAPRKKKSKEQENVVSLAEPISSQGRSGKPGHALPEAIGRIVNFYTTAQVIQAEGQHSCTLKRVLVDGGSVLNMMPLSLAKKMNLTLKPQTEVVMKTAASTFHEIMYYVDLEGTVAGVTASIRCYCLPGTYSRSSYTLLLGRRWMKQVQAIGDYAKDTYHIHDMAGYCYPVEATITSSDVQAEIPQMCTNTHVAASRSWDEESVDELRLSRNDLCKKLYQKIREQGTETDTDTGPDTDEATNKENSASDADGESSDCEEEEDADNDSGNDSRHEVPSLPVAAAKGAARFKMTN
jgi:hypothetical protein